MGNLTTNLDAKGIYKGINFLDPTGLQDLATRNYTMVDRQVQLTTPGSATVSTTFLTIPNGTITTANFGEPVSLLLSFYGLFDSNVGGTNTGQLRFVVNGEADAANLTNFKIQGFVNAAVRTSTGIPRVRLYAPGVTTPFTVSIQYVTNAGQQINCLEGVLIADIMRLTRKL